MMKIAMLAALIGHILCGVSDCLLSYSKSGRLNLKDITDPDKMSEMFEDMPLSFPLASIYGNIVYQDRNEEYQSASMGLCV